MNRKTFVAADVFVFHANRLHIVSFTQGIVYAGKLLHPEAFIQRCFDTEKPLRKGPLHTDAFTQRSLYTEELLHTEAFYTKKRLHTEAFTQKNLYTE